MKIFVLCICAIILECQYASAGGVPCLANSTSPECTTTTVATTTIIAPVSVDTTSKEPATTKSAESPVPEPEGTANATHSPTQTTSTSGSSGVTGSLIVAMLSVLPCLVIFDSL